jgi:hypothetical protein
VHCRTPAFWWAPIAVCCVLVSTTSAQSPPVKPKLSPGRDPGGALIGLMTTGIDPTRPDVARCLARDGEGELLGWDMVDNSRQPFRRAPPDQPGDDAEFAALPCDGRVRVAPVRIDPADPVTLGKALAFFSTTPARVVVIPPASQPADWTLFRQAALAFSQLQVLIAADTKPPALEGLQNVVAVPPATALSLATRPPQCHRPSDATARDPACR